MNIQQLKFLIAVSEHHQFTAASNELYVSQSSLSKQIMALEKEIGVVLFHRDTRNVSLTPAGEQVLEYARNMITEYECIQQAAASVSHAGIKEVSVGAVPILNHYGITEQLMRFRRAHGEISVKICETVTADVFDMLDREKIDLGIIRTPYKKDSCYDLIPILEDEYVLLVSKQHPLSDLGEVEMEQFEDDRFLLMDTDPYYTQFYLKLLQEAGIHPTVEYTKMRLETIKVCIMKNNCVSIMMNRVAAYNKPEGTRILHFKGHPSLYLAIVAKKGAQLSQNGQLLSSFLLNTVK